MLTPKRSKFRKYQKGYKKGVQPNTAELEYGRYGLKALGDGQIPAKTIEAVRRVMTREFKRCGKIWIRIFPDIVVTRKPSEARMGKGKGAPSHWICPIQAGQILYEMDGISFSLAKQAAQLAYSKLPVKSRFISVNGQSAGSASERALERGLLSLNLSRGVYPNKNSLHPSPT